MKEKFKNLRLSSGVLMTALLIVLIVSMLFFLIRSGILVPHPGESENEQETVGFLPEMEQPGTVDVEYYPVRDLEPEELLPMLKSVTSYEWIFRSVEAWQNEYTVERTVVLQNGKKYRIEKENLLVICDGEQLYRREGMTETICPANSSDLYFEAGLTPMDVIQFSENDGYACTMEYDDAVNPRRIRLSRTRDGYRDEFVISIEAGIALTERSYTGSMAYRIILTDSFAVTEWQDDSQFTIPEIN